MKNKASHKYVGPTNLRLWSQDDVMVAKIYGDKHPDGGEYAPLFETSDKQLAAAIVQRYNSAPDLLAACRAALGMFDTCLTAENIRELNETPGKVRAAIAKAEQVP